MITFRKDAKQFQFRTVGIMRNETYVLLHRADCDDFWSLPGGRVEFLEKAESAVVREMKEELDVDVTVERLVWVVENFFETRNISHHELALYFLLQLPKDSPILQETSEFSGKEEFYNEQFLSLIFKWFPLDQLDSLTLYPSFLKTSLPSLPTRTGHIVHIGNGDVTVT